MASAWTGAPRTTGLILFDDAASFAQGGSLRYTWARRGPQPEVPTRGPRKGYKVCGALEDFSGRLCGQSIAGRFPSDSDPTCLQMSWDRTQEHRLVIPEGARDHTRASSQAFWLAQSARLTASPWSSYAPEDQPMAYLWKKTKPRATPNQDCKELATLTLLVDHALAYFATPPEAVLGLFGLYCEESGLALKQAA